MSHEHDCQQRECDHDTAECETAQYGINACLRINCWTNRRPARQLLMSMPICIGSPNENERMAVDNRSLRQPKQEHEAPEQERLVDKIDW